MDKVAYPHTISILEGLTLDSLVQIARHNVQIQPIDPADPHPAIRRIQQSAAWVQDAMQEVESAEAEGRAPVAYYGINTGFGDNAGRATFKRMEDAAWLSRKLLISHAVGVGDHLSYPVVRASLALRIANLIHGYSGARLELINTLIAMLNRGVYPVVPSQGSMGASGDLAPLAHLVLPLSAPLSEEDAHYPGATGWCYLDGQIVTGADAMAAAGIPQIKLGAKEGLALINGTAISTAIAALTLYDAQQSLQLAQHTLALSMEALRGFRDAFLPHIHRLRNRYQLEQAESVLGLLQGSTLVRGDSMQDLPVHEGPPQDPYSIRCAPVVMGAVARMLEHVQSILDDELNAVTDNPLIFADPDDELPRATKVISGGNFHGEPIGLAMDYLTIAMAELANITERRIFAMMDGHLNRGLPPFLMPDGTGLNTGLMMAQYTAASLVSENKTLAFPASVDSIPTSANREDHVSMSTVAARKAAQVVHNVQKVLALELLCATQALELRLEQEPTLQCGASSRQLLARIRRVEIAEGVTLGLLREDRPLAPYVEAIIKLVRQGNWLTD